MSLRDSPLGALKVPLTWTAAVALIVAVVAALAFLLGDRRETLRASAYDQVRRSADTVTAPVGKVLSAPVHWVGGAGSYLGSYIDAAGENRRLKVQLATDNQWRDEALRLREENARYRALMGVKTDPPIATVFARTLTDSRGPFSNTRLADAGSAKGVVEGNPVLAEHGLVGRVTGVAPDVSRIMMLTDTESRTPVMVSRTNARAILTGDGGPSPRLDYLRTHDPIAEGDRVATSGDGGVYPRGLPVGVVVKDLDGGWRVTLDSDASPIDYVQILLFRDFSQLISKAALEPRTLPSAMTEEPRPVAAAPAAPVKPKPAAAADTAAPVSAKP
ncbi:MAG TPA: rod shape-determining protein MreC, partial [Caulobacteraceae bacterium]